MSAIGQQPAFILGERERTLNAKNIDRELQNYTRCVEDVGHCIRGLTGFRLIEELKRGKVGAGPYPNVALFEAANRIMTDLVILHGVRYLLNEQVFPFTAYTVEFGHENATDHDIQAAEGGSTLIGEAFNVAPSFFPVKKGSALKKLRASVKKATYRVILCNESALGGRKLKPQLGEGFVCIDIDTGRGRVIRGGDQ